MISTIGTALWNLGFETLFIVLGLWLLVRLDHDSAGRTDPYILGLLLFAAFLSRLTAVIFIIVTLIFIGIRRRVYFIKTAATALLLLVLFILFSKTEYGTWLPPYYLPGRLGTGDTPFLITLYGLLFSPSRGIFIFSPMFLPAIALFIFLAYQMRSRLPLLLWFAAIWFLAAVLSVSRFGHWWGGQSFGPRLLTDAVPALILLTIVTWYELRPKLSTKTARWIIALFLLLAIASITINTYSGLFNLQTIRWNGGMLPPDIDHAPQYLFSWRYPQFLANEELICNRNKDYFETSLLTRHIALASYQLGHVVTSHEAQATMRIPPAPNWFLPANWDGQERFESKHIVAANQVFLPAVLGRWPIAAAFVGAAYQNGETIEMRCNPASIVIGAAELGGSDQALVLKVQMGAITEHDIHVSLNGTASEVLTVDRQSMVAELPVNPLLLLPDKPNWITFTVPDQQSSALEIDRTTWPSIKSVSIEAVD